MCGGVGVGVEARQEGTLAGGVRAGQHLAARVTPGGHWGVGVGGGLGGVHCLLFPALLQLHLRKEGKVTLVVILERLINALPSFLSFRVYIMFSPSLSPSSQG